MTEAKEKDTEREKSFHSLSPYGFGSSQLESGFLCATDGFVKIQTTFDGLFGHFNGCRRQRGFCSLWKPHSFFSFPQDTVLIKTLEGGKEINKVSFYLST